MSGYPGLATISKVKQCLIREAEIEDKLRESMETMKLIKAQHQALSEELCALRKKRWEMMERMDLTSSGNNGYEARTNVFLMELVKPIEESKA